EPVEQHREDGAEDGRGDERDPDVHAGVVGDPGRERGRGHDVAVREVQDVRDAELERETDGCDREDRRRYEAEAERGDCLVDQLYLAMSAAVTMSSCGFDPSGA